jgi:hypothetical protein
MRNQAVERHFGKISRLLVWVGQEICFCAVPRDTSGPRVTFEEIDWRQPLAAEQLKSRR